MEPFIFNTQNIAAAITPIQRIHHLRYFSHAPMADLNLKGLSGEHFNDDFFVMEMRGAVMIIRRGLMRDESRGNPPYMPMETRQLLGKIRQEDLGDAEDFVKDLAESIYDAVEQLTWTGPVTQTNPIRPRYMATSAKVNSPGWRPTTEEEVLATLKDIVRFSQVDHVFNLTIRFSNNRGLTVSSQVPNWAAKDIPPSLIQHRVAGRKDETIALTRLSH